MAICKSEFREQSFIHECRKKKGHKGQHRCGKPKDLSGKSCGRRWADKRKK